ncbi:hypothetical protein DsansV1_C42g0239121 [Dioscorea sansibarensis]
MKWKKCLVASRQDHDATFMMHVSSGRGPLNAAMKNENKWILSLRIL